MSRRFKILVISRSDAWVENLLPSLKNLGHDVSLLDRAVASEAEIDAAFNRRPDFTLGSSYYPIDKTDLTHSQSHLQIHHLSEKFKIPMALWMTDGQYTGSYFWREKYKHEKFPTYLKFFALDHEHLKYFKSKGSDAFHLPLGVPEKWESFRPQPQLAERFKCDASFVGKPPLFDIQGPIESDEKLRQVFSVLSIREMGDLLREIFIHEKRQMTETDLGNLLARLWEGLDRLIERRIEDPHLFRSAVSEWIDSQDEWRPRVLREPIEIWCDRLPMLVSYYQMCHALRNLKQPGLKVFGGKEWNFYLNRADAGGRLTDEELFNLFSACTINICFTKIHFFTAVHERPLLVMAAGGFALTDRRGEIEEFFSADEVATFASLAELNDKINFYLARPELRSKMIEAGRRRVFAQHTFGHRMATLVDKMAAFC